MSIQLISINSGGGSGDSNR